MDSHVDILQRGRGCGNATWDLTDLVGGVLGGDEKAKATDAHNYPNRIALDVVDPSALKYHNWAGLFALL